MMTVADTGMLVNGVKVQARFDEFKLINICDLEVIIPEPEVQVIRDPWIDMVPHEVPIHIPAEDVDEITISIIKNLNTENQLN